MPYDIVESIAKSAVNTKTQNQAHKAESNEALIFCCLLLNGDVDLLIVIITHTSDSNSDKPITEPSTGSRKTNFAIKHSETAATVRMINNIRIQIGSS